MSRIPLSGLPTYFFADLAAGKEARSRTRTARQTILGVAMDDLSRYFVIHSWAGRETASTFQEKILSAYELYQPKLFGLEANGMQVLFGAQVRDEGKKRFGKYTRFIPIYQPTKVDKNYRIRTGLQPVLNFGRLFLREQDVELQVEIRGFPTAQTKDLIDSLETVISRVCPKTPEKVAQSDSLREYSAYLRNSGCPPHLIRDKVRQFQLENGISPLD